MCSFFMSQNYVPPEPLEVSEIDEIVLLRENLDTEMVPNVERAISMFRAHCNPP